MTNTLADYVLFRNMNTHGAIAYNSSTRLYGWSFGQRSAEAASQMAISYCPGGRIVASGQGNAFLALALTPDGSWGRGFGVNAKIAKKDALANCSRQGSDAQVVLVINALRGLQEEYPAPQAVPLAPPGVGSDGVYRHPQGWGAISCSVKTSTFSYSFGELDEQAAIRAAIRNCRAADAQAPVSGFHVYLALARCGTSFSWGRGDSQTEAEQRALRGCAELAGRVVLVIHTLSGDVSQPPKLVLDPD